MYRYNWSISSVHFSSSTQLCLTFCDPMDYNMPGFPVHHQLPELTQTHVHWVGDPIQLEYSWFKHIVGKIPWRRVIHASILVWRIPWTEEPGGLQSIGSQRVRHDWSNLAYTHTYICICVYTYICVYIYIYRHTHTHTHIYIYTHRERESYREGEIPDDIIWTSRSNHV